MNDDRTITQRCLARAGDLMLWLSGADPEVLARADRERGKFVAMGGTVATTGALACLAATFTTADFLHAPLPIALLMGAGWGIAIINLDRWLLISIRRQDTTAKTVMMALPRIFLALIVGLVIAEPLVLRVFESEVQLQAEDDQSAERKAAKQQLEDEYDDIPRLEQALAKVRREIDEAADGDILATSAAFAAISDRVAQLNERASAAEAAGDPSAEALRATTDRAEARMSDMRDSLLGRERRLRIRARWSARREETRIEGKLETRRAELDAQLGRLDDKYDKEIGLLDRVEALDNLTGENGAILAIRLALLLFVLSIDALPAVAKVLMSTGRRSLYEDAQDALDELDRVSVGAHVDAHVQAAKLSAAIVVDEAEIRRELTREVQRDLMRQAVEIMREAGESFLAEWRKFVLARIEDLARDEARRSGLLDDEDKEDDEDDDEDDDEPLVAA